MSSGVLQVFCPGFQPVAGMPDWPAGLVAWGRGVPCSLIAAGPVERPVRVKDRAEPGRRSRRRRRPGHGGPRSDNRAAGNRRVCGCGCGPDGQLRCWRAWLRSSLRVGPRLAAAGHGAGPRGQRDQSGARPRRRGAGARHGGDHALPAAGPAHPAFCSAKRAVRDLTCPSRIA